jgi:DHA1 family inner membrane transport protein
MTSETTAYPSRQQLLIILIALGMGGFAIGTTEFATMSLLPYFAPDLAISEAVASHVISAYAAGVVVGAPLLAVAGARQPRKRMLLWLMLAFALFNGLSALANTYGSMLLIRFLSGIPHGAYFGTMALVAADLVPPAARARAVGRAMLGLTIATIIGVPMANLIGQEFGWRWGFALVAFTALLTVLLVWRFVPQDTPHEDAHPMRELRGLRNRHLWMTLAIAAIGFGGLFAVYTYVASTLIQVTGSGAASVPWVLACMGAGMTTGTLGYAWLADKLGMRAAVIGLSWSVITLLIYPQATGNVWTMCLMTYCVGHVGGLGVVLQTRLMDVAGDAQMIAASLNHSAFNVANALGPFFASFALTFGWGLPATGYVGAAMAGCGLILCVFSLRMRH